MHLVELRGKGGMWQTPLREDAQFSQSPSATAFLRLTDGTTPIAGLRYRLASCFPICHPGYIHSLYGGLWGLALTAWQTPKCVPDASGRNDRNRCAEATEESTDGLYNDPT